MTSVDRGGKEVVLLLSDMAVSGPAAKETTGGSHLYADRAGSFSGEWTCGAAPNRSAFKANLQLSAGWNVVVTRFKPTPPDGFEWRNETGPLPADLKWRLAPGP